MLKIAQNGPKWLKMVAKIVQNQKVGPNVQFLKMKKNTKIAENSSKWSKMAKNGQTSKIWSQCAVP